MSGTRELLGKIAALRQRLEQAQGLASEAGSTAVSLLEEQGEGLAQLWALEQKAQQGQEQARMLEEVLPQLPEEQPRFPKQLIARAHRAIVRGRELLGDLRRLGEEPELQNRQEPLARLYRETTALADTALRMIQRFPDSAGAQLPLCEGIEVMLKDVEERLHRIRGALGHRKARHARVVRLKEWILVAHRGCAAETKTLGDLAGEILAEAARGAPLIFHEARVPSAPDVEWIAEHVACHGLMVAQVLARLIEGDCAFRNGASEAVIAALIHDIGMLAVAPEVLAKREAWSEADRRAVESHCFEGAEMLRRALPNSTSLIEAAHHHHERGSGTGYPTGRKADGTSHLLHCLAVCDVYSACCSARPHRRSLGTRRAMTEVLLLAERGELDKKCAERLLRLGFYPVGSIVELSEGALGVVIGAPKETDDPTGPAKPVVTVLTDDERRPLVPPRIVDLAKGGRESIVRSLDTDEARRLLGSCHPELVG